MNKQMAAATVLAAMLTIVAAGYWPNLFFVVGGFYCIVWCAIQIDRRFPYAARFISGFLRGLFGVLVLAVMMSPALASCKTVCTSRTSIVGTSTTTCRETCSRQSSKTTTCRSYTTITGTTKTECR